MNKIEKYMKEIDVAVGQIDKWTEKKRAAMDKLKMAYMETVHAEMKAQNLSWEDTLEILRHHGAVAPHINVSK